MPPPGGLADKIGNRFEGRVAIGRLLQLIDDQHDSVLFRLEQPGDDSFEWWVQSASGSRAYTQVKRQQSLDEEWTIKTLVSRGVIPAFGRRLAEEPDAHCEFFSALSASHLLQMGDDARTAGSLQEFGASAVSKSWARLEGTYKLARRERSGRLAKVTALHESGNGKKYTYPDKAYFKLPYDYRTADQAWYYSLSFAGKAVLLIAFLLKQPFVLPADRAARWYGLSSDSLERGLRELREAGLLKCRTATVESWLSPTGATTRYDYWLQPPFARARRATRRGQVRLKVVGK